MSRKAILILLAVGLAAVFLLAAAAPEAPARGAGHVVVAPEGRGPSAEVFYLSSGSWLGVSIADIDGGRAEELGLDGPRGAEIKGVVPGSPADEAGLEEGEVILVYDGTTVRGVSQLTRLVRETPPGRTVPIEVFDGGSTRSVQVKVAGRDAEDVRAIIRSIRIPDLEVGDIEIPDIDIPHVRALELRGRVRLGVQVENLTGQLGEYFGVEGGRGVLVRSVRKGSPGDRGGVRAGDVIVGVDEEEIRRTSDLRRALRERAGETITLTIVRDRRETELSVTLPEGRSGSKSRFHLREGGCRREEASAPAGEAAVAV
ncbi:MAG: PDZ domain-containing protein [Acidobacteriota bacterium]